MATKLPTGPDVCEELRAEIKRMQDELRAEIKRLHDCYCHSQQQLVESQQDIKLLRDALEKAKHLIKTLDCECDEYQGYVCPIHGVLSAIETALAGKEMK